MTTGTKQRNRIGLNRISTQQSKQIRNLHRHWAPGEPVPAAIGDSATQLLVATLNHRPAGYVVVSPPRGLKAVARRAGWPAAGLAHLDNTAVVDALVIDPNLRDRPAEIGDALADALHAAVTVGGSGSLRVCGETTPDNADFWTGHGFQISDTLVWTYPNARPLSHPAKPGRCWFHREVTP